MNHIYVTALSDTVIIVPSRKMFLNQRQMLQISSYMKMSQAKSLKENNRLLFEPYLENFLFLQK